jgi:hypothetical protein
MRKTLGFLLVLVGACGGIIDDGPSDQGTGGRAGKGGNSGTGSSVGGTNSSVGGTNSSVGGTSPGGRGGRGGTGGKGGASGNGGGGGDLIGGAGGSGGSPDVPWEVTLHMLPFRVEPGRDTYMCQDFKNPFGGVAVEIGEFESHMTSGSHHLVFNYSEGATDTSPTPCSGLEIPSGPFATQTRDDQLIYPEGIAAPLPGNTGFHLNSHYFNPGNEAFEANVSITIRRVAPETVRAHALSTISIAFNINVPANSVGSAGSQLSFSEDVQLLWLMPHMHMHGTRFSVDMGGSRILETDDWESPPVQYSPPIPIPGNQALSYNCQYKNDGAVPLSFGESAANSEMCILIAQYYLNSDWAR